MQSNSIPQPDKNDIFDMLIASAACRDLLFHYDEVSEESYTQECASLFHHQIKHALCTTSIDSAELIMFWKKHRNYADWGFLPHRKDGYDFLNECY